MLFRTARFQRFRTADLSSITVLPSIFAALGDRMRSSPRQLGHRLFPGRIRKRFDWNLSPCACSSRGGPLVRSCRRGCMPPPKEARGYWRSAVVGSSGGRANMTIVEELHPSRRLGLTSKETECLRWCKEGKTNWEIGE